MITPILITLILITLTHTEIVAFDQNIADRVFKKKHPALLLLLGDEEKESYEFGAFARFQMSSQGLTAIAAVLRKQDGTGLYSKAREHLGTPPDTPQIIYINQLQQIFLFDKTKQSISVDSIAAFYAHAQAGSLNPYLKSQPAPSQPSNTHVLTLVASTFREQVLLSEQQILVKFYAPWCKHCKDMAPAFEQAAEILKNNPNLRLAQFDASANTPPRSATSYPTLLFYRKDKQETPLQYTGKRTAEHIIAFLRQHSEYEWEGPWDHDSDSDFDSQL